MTSLLKRAWIPLLIVVVVVIAGFSVQRIRTFFGAEGIIVTPKNFADDPEPFNPKVVKYEIFGEPAPTPTSTTSISTPSRSASTAPRCRGRWS